MHDSLIHYRLHKLKPLTDEQLRELWRAGPDRETTRALLWEIRRLQERLVDIEMTLLQLHAGILGAEYSVPHHMRQLMEEPGVQRAIQTTCPG